MVYNTVLTAEKRGPQIVGAQIAGVYCILKDVRMSEKLKKLNSVDSLPRKLRFTLWMRPNLGFY